jgi:hypothetical protein
MPLTLVSNICWAVQHKFTAFLQICRFSVAQKFCYRRQRLFTWSSLFGALFVFTDEALFHFAWIYNSQNSRIRIAENPLELYANPLILSEIGVWCALYQKGAMGPLLFQDTITAGNYSNLLMQIVVLLEENKWDCCISILGWPPLLRKL